MKPLFIIFCLFFLGCSQTPKSEFSKAKNFTKTIDQGLYFIRSLRPKTLSGKEENTKYNWKNTAKYLCAGEYKTLLLVDSENSSHGSIINIFAGAIIPIPTTFTTPVTDAVVLCKSSSLSEQQAKQRLIEDVYIIPDTNS